jgi:hypothetical protein
MEEGRKDLEPGGKGAPERAAAAPRKPVHSLFFNKYGMDGVPVPHYHEGLREAAGWVRPQVLPQVFRSVLGTKLRLATDR